MTIGDFNGDGIADLAVANSGNDYSDSGSVMILLGNGDGTFQAAQSIAAGPHPLSVVVADFNGDGTADLAVGNDSRMVGILLGNGNGTFQAAPTYITGTLPVSLTVGDFNGDGLPDLAVGNHTTLYNNRHTALTILLNQAHAN